MIIFDHFVVEIRHISKSHCFHTFKIINLNTLKTYPIVDMKEIIVKDEKTPLAKLKKTRSLLDDVAEEMSEKYEIVKNVVFRLINDTWTEEILDEDDILVATKTHVHPQLLKWLREARMFCNDMWKLSGGEIQQEGEKKILEVQAKLVMKAVGDDPEKYKEKLEIWKKNRSFKEE